MPLCRWRNTAGNGTSITSGPAGTPAKRTRRRDLSFVDQKHDATNLHFDFRLEINGVLVSWAVPRGPSLNPADKRLAIMMEDHPLEYAGFEGTIPEGHYWVGAVMVWDCGSYEASESESGLAAGEFKFSLQGVKLRGQFVLIHSAARSSDPKQARRWLLIKIRDEYADAEFDIESPAWSNSVLSGRSMDEIAGGKAARKIKRATKIT